MADNYAFYLPPIPISDRTRPRDGAGSDPLTYRPSDRPTYLMPLEPRVRPHPLTYLRGMTDLPEPVCAVRGQRVDPLDDLPDHPPASQRYPLTGPSDMTP